MPLPRWRKRPKPYVLRIPNPRTKGKQAIQRWHKVSPADTAWTICNIPIGSLWQRSEEGPAVDSEVPLCRWCFPKS